MTADLGSPGALEALLVAYARGFPVRRGKLRLVNSLWRIAAGPNRRRLAHLRRGLQMPCDLNEMLQRQFYFFGTYFLEADLLDGWAAVTRGAKTVFDVGANSGIYALEALAANPQAVVHAFEPTPEIAGRLRETARLNALSSLLVHELAASDRDGEAVLRRWRGESGDNEGMNYVVSRESVGDGAEAVRTVRLDSFCAERALDRIDVLKLDVQGQEAAVLEGAGDLVGEGRIGAVFLELNWDRDGDGPAARAVDLLARAGYSFSPPGRRPEPRAAGDWLKGHSDAVAFAPGGAAA